MPAARTESVRGQVANADYIERAYRAGMRWTYIGGGLGLACTLSVFWTHVVFAIGGVLLTLALHRIGVVRYETLVARGWLAEFGFPHRRYGWRLKQACQRGA